MDKAQKLAKMTEVMSKFVGLISYKLPDDVEAKLRALGEKETNPLAKKMFETMFYNQEKAFELKVPSCQDTGALQYYVNVGENFPHMGKLQEVLEVATIHSTEVTPLRPNAVETFDEFNTKNNVGTGLPTIDWTVIPERDDCEIYVYMSGGGCSLPGVGQVFMPSEGYEAATKMVLDRMTSYALNACPPVLVGIGFGTSIDTAAKNSKKALLRDVDSVNPNPKVAEYEKRMEDAINAIGLGPQGFGGDGSIMGLNVVNTARHPSVLGCVISIGCWAHRRGRITFDKDLNYVLNSHKGVNLS